jgi:protein-tyrosine kinase
MGKIHDALEKAHKKINKPSLSNRGRQQPEVQVNQSAGAQNVVQLQVKSNYSMLSYDPSLVALHRPHSIESEMFKNLRTKILFPENGKRIKTILVTSASSGDGKTFVSTNLACSIAQGIEEHVLLIDCDMRSPSVHKVFGMSQVHGLSDYLLSGMPIPEIICKTRLEKLSFISGGATPPNPAELLSSNKMASFLKETKDRYDDRYIILDSPPPMITAETKALSRLVDGVIIVLKSFKTKKKITKEIIDEIGKDKIIGVVVNHVDKLYMKYGGYADMEKYSVNK